MQCVLACIDADGAGGHSACRRGHCSLLVSFEAPSDSESRWGREHGRSIPFSEVRVYLKTGAAHCDGAHHHLSNGRSMETESGCSGLRKGRRLAWAPTNRISWKEGLM